MRLGPGLALTLAGLLSTLTAAREVLANADVVAMVKGRLGADIVAQTIEQSATDFDLTTSALLELEEAGVPDLVLSKMLERMPSSTCATKASPTFALTSGGSEMLRVPAS